jgi:hypothetical protein
VAKWLSEDEAAEDERARYREAHGSAPNGSTSWTALNAEYVRERVSLDFWHARELPPLDPLLGDLFTTTSRIMLVGPTGLGKTTILMAAGFVMADGTDFLHWRGGGKPRRVLYIDGEMSRRLFRSRIDDAARRHGNRPSGFYAFSREDFEEMPPLDTEPGQKYIDHVIEALGGIDMLMLDNIQALTMGDLRDPESWRRVLPWMRQLTARGIGQTWAHHTGHNEDRAYGDKGREWQLDTVILLETIERPDTDIAFAMKFPKARERTPDNRGDFEKAVIFLANDAWVSERGNIAGQKKSSKDYALEILIDEIARHGTIPPRMNEFHRTHHVSPLECGVRLASCVSYRKARKPAKEPSTEPVKISSRNKSS